MGKILIEKSAPLKYIKESNTISGGKHSLGKLAGVASDWTTKTRNDRRYPYELWVNVQNSDDFKEGMETLTIFGEADHPEDRIDTSIKEVAIVMTKFEIRQTEGYVYAEFDILDTPNGRILKELLDYGSKIGVSSRGLGDEVVVDGETIIDPETYVFYGYDAVIMPAVTTARPTVIESVDSNKSKSLVEAFNREINDATSVAELKSIEKLAETVNIPDLDSVKESIKTKIGSYNEGEDISSLRSDLATLTKTNEDLMKKISVLESKLSARNTRISRLREQISRVTESSSNLRKLLIDATKSSKDKDDAILEGVSQIDDLTDLIDDMKVSFGKSIISMKENYRVEVSELSNKLDMLTEQNGALRGEVKKYRSRISTLIDNSNKNVSIIESLKSSNSKLTESNMLLKKQLESAKSNSILSEKNRSRVESSLKERLKSTKESAKVATEKYLQVKCAEFGIDVQTAKYNLPKNYTTEDIDKVVSTLSDRKIRMSKVSFAIQSDPIRVTEVRANTLQGSNEDNQTMEFLKEAMNNK